MALVVEDGTGKTDAESYISVTDADTRQASLGETDWAALETAAKEQLLRKATNYMTQKYRDSWKGYRTSTTQLLCWPRSGVVVDLSTTIDVDSLPADIANACSDLALTANDGELLADTTRPVIEKTIGPLTTKYGEGAAQATRYNAVESILRPYLDGLGNNSIALERA